ncbi:MAG: 50S ribosomal protein L23, partial [Patescibacteria group bacterium]
MAIFKSKTNTKKATAPKAGVKKAEAKTPAPKKAEKVEKVSAGAVSSHNANALVRPRITEKAANMTAQGVYTFDIRKDATKKDVMTAVVALYKVTPIKVNVVNTPA